MQQQKPQQSVWHRLREHLFSSPLNIILTLLCSWLLLMTLPGIIDWAFLNATFSAPDAATCRLAAGACWAFITEKHRLILFGTYPYDDQWRPAIASLVLIAVIIISCLPRFWRRELALIWLVGLSLVGLLMWGGVLGLDYVATDRWGGLPLTLILTTFGIAFAFPLGILLALGRRSNMPVIRTLSVIYIELVRGVPLISLLFMSSVMLPLFLPAGITIDKLLRAQIAIILFTAAYIAEVIRGGLQAIPKGQFEGADAIGLNYYLQMRLIILPQALKLVIPSLVSLFIGLFKDTSLVVVIGLFDLTNAARTAVNDNEWRGFSLESYVFIAIIYFIFCYAMSKYSKSIEQRLSY